MTETIKKNKIKELDEKGNLFYREMTQEEYLKEVYEGAKKLPTAQSFPEEFEKCFKEEREHLIENFNMGMFVGSSISYIDLMI